MLKKQRSHLNVRCRKGTQQGPCQNQGGIRKSEKTLQRRSLSRDWKRKQRELSKSIPNREKGPRKDRVYSRRIKVRFPRCEHQEGTCRLCLWTGRLLWRDHQYLLSRRLIKYYFHTFVNSGPAKSKPDQLTVITQAQIVRSRDRVLPSPAVSPAQREAVNCCVP